MCGNSSCRTCSFFKNIVWTSVGVSHFTTKNLWLKNTVVWKYQLLMICPSFCSTTILKENVYIYIVFTPPQIIHKWLKSSLLLWLYPVTTEMKWPSENLTTSDLLCKHWARPKLPCIQLPSFYNIWWMHKLFVAYFECFILEIGQSIHSSYYFIFFQFSDNRGHNISPKQFLWISGRTKYTIMFF